MKIKYNVSYLIDKNITDTKLKEIINKKIYNIIILNEMSNINE